MRTYRAYLSSYLKWNGGDGIDMHSYDRFIMHMRRKGHGQNGIATASAVLRAYARFLHINVQEWQSPRTQGVAINYLRPNQIKLLRDACLQGEKAELELFCFDFLLGTGLRVTELIKLMWTDIDLKEKTLIVREAKENKTRTIKFTATAWKAAMRWALFMYGEGATPERMQLVAEKVIPLTSKEGVETMFRRIASRAHLDMIGLHPHLLRHTFAVIMIKYRIMSVRQLQLHLGHASIATTQRYMQFALLESEQGLEDVDVAEPPMAVMEGLQF